VTSYDYLWFKAAWISSTAFYFNIAKRSS
jgi:hypothetical protein